MAYGDRFPHTAQVIEHRETGERIEGEKEVQDVAGAQFPCFLLLPTGGKEQPVPRGRRTITTPTLLLPPDIELSSAADIDVVAPELPPPYGGPTPVRWQVVGEATPFVRPGQMVGSMVTLKRVND